MERGQRLVGRDDALEQVERAVDAACRGEGSTLLVTGAAGMGKTSLLRAALGAADGVDLAWGTCVEGGAAGFRPWVQALDGLLRAVGSERGARAAAGDTALLATLVPGLGAASGVAADSGRERMRLLDAAVAWLRALAAERPVVLVLDDLHWVDESSLGLLELLAQDPRPTPLCVLGAFRHDDVPRALGGRLTALVERTDHVHLTGLDRAAVGELVSGVCGPERADAVADAAFARAGGHPFFTRELALAARDGLPAEQVPVAVRDAVARRVRALPAAARQVLEAAAVTGPLLLPDVLCAVTGLPAREVAESVASAGAAGVVTTDDDGRARFSHDLFRQVVADSVEAARRGPLHLAIGRALEVRSGRAGDVAASDVARHLCAAVGHVDLRDAVTWALRAADADRAALALTEAAGHLRRLRAAVADAGAELPHDLLVGVLLAEADALARAGRTPDARGLVRAARGAAERAGDAAGITRAALAAAGLGSRFATRRDEVVEELESALAAVSGGEPALEARLAAALARELQHSVPEQRARSGPLTARALELGRATGDEDVLAACLLARHDVLWTPGRAAERAEVTAELVALSRRSGDRERLAEALLLHANALLEGGSAAFGPALEESLALLEELGQPRHRYTVLTRRACLALLRGRLDDAEALIEDAASLGERLREPDTGNVRMSQLLELVRARGEPEELRRFAAAAVEHWTGAPVHAHAVAAGFSARAGDLETARRHVGAVHDLGGWRADTSYLWSVYVRELAVAAVALGDLDLCVDLLDALRPLAGSCGVNGAAVAFAGCHSHTAGRLAAAAGDDGAARALLGDACAVYGRLDAAAAAEARQELADLAGTAPTAALRRRGPVWEIAYGGRTATVPHVKGLSDLAHLLRRPGADVHALDLTGSAVRSAPAGEVLDRAAVGSYRRRLAELAEARAAAERDGDAGDLAAVDAEHDALVAELGAGTAAGGRARAFANHPAERARKAVTARIRDAVRRLEPELPELAAHLDRTVVTGLRCRYGGSQEWVVEDGAVAGSPRPPRAPGRPAG